MVAQGFVGGGGADGAADVVDGLVEGFVKVASRRLVTPNAALRLALMRSMRYAMPQASITTRSGRRGRKAHRTT